MDEDYVIAVIAKIITKIKELDHAISIPDYSTECITLKKEHNDDNFLSKCISVSEILKLEYIFGVDMIAEDIVNSLNEDIEECFEGE